MCGGICFQILPYAKRYSLFPGKSPSISSKSESESLGWSQSHCQSSVRGIHIRVNGFLFPLVESPYQFLFCANGCIRALGEHIMELWGTRELSNSALMGLGTGVLRFWELLLSSWWGDLGGKVLGFWEVGNCQVLVWGGVVLGVLEFWEISIVRFSHWWWGGLGGPRGARVLGHRFYLQQKGEYPMGTSHKKSSESRQ